MGPPYKSQNYFSTKSSFFSLIKRIRDKKKGRKLSHTGTQTVIQMTKYPLFEHLDRNKDGKITKLEFLNVFKAGSLRAIAEFFK